MSLGVKCDWCGKVFLRKNAQHTEHAYCSRACLGKANADRYARQMTRVCDYCGKPFRWKGKHRHRNKHVFCSKECSDLFKIKKVTVHCDCCGTEFEKKRSDIGRTLHNFCSHDCELDFRRNHLTAKNGKFVDGQAVYRTIIENTLGIKLKPGEEIHHIDGNHKNNSIGNLRIVTKSEHSQIHAAMKRRNEHGQFISEKQPS